MWLSVMRDFEIVRQRLGSALTLFMTKCKSNEFSSKPLKNLNVQKAKEQNQA
jgi:hypothetical protein